MYIQIYIQINLKYRILYIIKSMILNITYICINIFSIFRAVYGIQKYAHPQLSPKMIISG